MTLLDPDARQFALGEWGAAEAPGREITVEEHRRRSRPKRADDEVDESDLRFDDDVPVEEIRIDVPDLDEDHEVIGEKVTCRLAQKPGAFVVVKLIRPVVKRKSDGRIVTAAAPPAVLGKSVADVSLLACMAIDKFVYHLPLYRQQQRMQAAGVRLARSTLTGLVHRTADLLQPIHDALFASVLQSDTLAMDETPIKAGRKGRGKMKTGYFWPIYGDKDEVVFPFSPSRSARFVHETLEGFEGVLLSDGYSAYDAFAAKADDVVHAQCWSHTRRQFVQAEDVEPELAGRALDLIGKLFEEEAQLKRRPLDDEKRLDLRARKCKPVVDEFFAWLKQTMEERVLLPSSPFSKAAEYALSREAALRVFLQFPAVPIDTNHLERQIRPIALGRKNWLFCWTEVGAQAVGIFQGLLATCRLQGVDPYTYLVDVLQRVDRHPASDVAALTPRLWKERFAGDPLRAVVDRIVKNGDS